MLLVVACVQKCSADQEKVLSGGGDAADSLPESVNFAVDIDMIVDVVLHENMEEEPEEPRVIEHDNQHYKLLKVRRGLRLAGFGSCRLHPGLRLVSTAQECDMGASLLNRP
jgi:hypothetical protein